MSTPTKTPTQLRQQIVEVFGHQPESIAIRVLETTDQVIQCIWGLDGSIQIIHYTDYPKKEIGVGLVLSSPAPSTPAWVSPYAEKQTPPTEEAPIETVCVDPRFTGVAPSDPRTKLLDLLGQVDPGRGADYFNAPRDLRKI